MHSFKSIYNLQETRHILSCAKHIKYIPTRCIRMETLFLSEVALVKTAYTCNHTGLPVCFEKFMDMMFT